MSEPLSEAVARLGAQVAGLRSLVESAEAYRRDIQRIDRELAELRVELAGATTRVLRHTIGIIVAGFIGAALAWFGVGR